MRKDKNNKEKRSSIVIDNYFIYHNSKAVFGLIQNWEEKKPTKSPVLLTSRRIELRLKIYHYRYIFLIKSRPS